MSVFTRQADKWEKEIIVRTRKNGETDMTEIKGKLDKVSSDASEVAKDADIFLLGGPAQANPIYLKAIAPYVKDGAWVGALYAQGGFDWAASDAFGGVEEIKKRNITLFGLLNIPWICKKIEYGKSARMIGPKKQLYVASSPVEKAPEVAALMEKFFDIKTGTIANFMSLTLTPSNQIIHPARFYGIFSQEGQLKWDGKSGYKNEDIPFLYDQVDDFSAFCLQVISDELQDIKKALEAKYSQLDLSAVKDLGERIIEHYGDDVVDKSSLKQIFCTNRGYTGCAVPVAPHPTEEGKVIPDVNSRLFIEDMPYGLCILINMADILGVKTPYCRKFLRYHQELMGVKYLTDDDELNPELIPFTGAPARYGLTTADKLVELSLPSSQ